MLPNCRLQIHADHPEQPVNGTVQHLLPLAGKRLVRLADLFARLDVSKATGHRMLAAGKIGVQRIRLSPGCVRVDADEVQAWLSNRKADGSLHDERTWPAIWAELRRRQGGGQ